MSKLPRLTPKQIISISIMQESGQTGLKGSHHIFIHHDSGRMVIVAVHPGREIPKGTLLEILKQAGITREDLEQ